MTTVEVTWRDAWYYGVDDDWDPDKQEHVMRTVGYLVERNSTRIAIAQELDPDDGPRCVTCIPTAMVMSVVQLEAP